MRCKGCDYPLWDIAARACPECGLPFRPSEYEFAVNSVRFCCHHCGQAYYGTGERGHLVPSRFNCISCARMIDMDEMLVLPRDGVPESISLPERMPWLERHRIGFWKALGGTWIRALGTPSRLADAIPKRAPDGSGGPTLFPALVYAMILVVPFMSLGAGIFMIFPILGIIAGVGGTAMGTVLAIASTILTIIISCIVLFAFWAALAHGALRATGPTPAGFPGTVAALAYSSGASFLAAIPCLSFVLLPVGMCWWALVATLMAIRIQRVSPVRSVFAFLIAPLLVISMLIGGAVLFAYTVAPNTGAFSGIYPPPPPLTPPPTATTATPPAGAPAAAPVAAPRSHAALADRVAGACLAYRDREGAWPRTGLDLVRGKDLPAAHLIASDNPGTAHAGGMTLEQVDLLLGDQLRLFADAFANESDHPSGISRAGSVITFTKGLPITRTDATPPAADAPEPGDAHAEITNDTIWIACVLPEGSAVPGMSPLLLAIDAEGRVTQHPLDQTSVDDQNRLRRAQDLPELPPLDAWP